MKKVEFEMLEASRIWGMGWCFPHRPTIHVGVWVKLLNGIRAEFQLQKHFGVIFSWEIVSNRSTLYITGTVISSSEAYTANPTDNLTIRTVLMVYFVYRTLCVIAFYFILFSDSQGSQLSWNFRSVLKFEFVLKFYLFGKNVLKLAFEFDTQ